jgi:hypothetical protein
VGSIFKWIAVVLLGIALGAGFAIYQIRSTGLGNDIEIGPWTTGKDIGTINTDMKNRAIVALRGLLALPKEEARYFTAATDSAGAPLSGRCSYTVTGGAFDARWWSVTLYDRGGWLIPNRWNRHSIGSAAIPADQANAWSFSIAPTEQPGLWIPTATDGLFELTVRTYRPRGVLASDPGRVTMPTITKGECRS